MTPLSTPSWRPTAVLLLSIVMSLTVQFGDAQAERANHKPAQERSLAKLTEKAHSNEGDRRNGDDHRDDDDNHSNPMIAAKDARYHAGEVTASCSIAAEI